MTPAFINQIMFVTPAFNRDQALIQTCVYSRKYGTNNIYHPLCKYLRVPYGISSISEHYNRRMDEAFNGLSGFRCIVEDIVIYDNDVIQHESHVIRSFCNDHKITLNTSKFKYAKPEVQFAGFILSADGYRMDPAITDAIEQFPTPTNRTDLRSFFGLVNLLSACTDTIAPLLAPLRPLLSIKNDFVWTPNHDLAFGKSKESLTSSPTLSFFDVRQANAVVY